LKAEVKTLKKEKVQLMTELHQHKKTAAEQKRKIESLEVIIRSTEEENNLLRKFNEIFGDENDKLLKENESLKKEVAKYKQLRIPLGHQDLTLPDDNRSRVIGRKRSKYSSKTVSPEAESSDEREAVKARVRFFS
jgi:hypothetical protein